MAGWSAMSRPWSSSSTSSARRFRSSAYRTRIVTGRSRGVLLSGAGAVHVPHGRQVETDGVARLDELRRHYVGAVRQLRRFEGGVRLLPGGGAVSAILTNTAPGRRR